MDLEKNPGHPDLEEEIGMLVLYILIQRPLTKFLT